MIEYVSCAETAKIIRKALKSAFPGIKFSVRSQTYSGGASIDVNWTDGPSQKTVDRVVKLYQAAGFDGMEDYKYSRDHWRLPDGSIVLRSVEGHYGSERREIEAPCPEAVVVRLGADYIFTHRELSESWVSKCGAAWQQLNGHEQCDLLNNVDFPRWERTDKGKCLAAFLSVPEHKEEPPTATNRPGDEAAIVAEETGMSYERALVFCNMD